MFTFDHFGKDFARRHNISTDSLMQIGIQLAYYRIYHEHPPTYQSTTLRQFEGGRTGMVRLPNFQMSMFTYEMTDADEKPSDNELIHMLQVAAQQHKSHTLQVTFFE